MRKAVGDVDRLYDEIEVVDIDEDLAHRAGALAEVHGLRGYDAVHLASALSIDAPRVVVATWDRDLSAAAMANGVAVVPYAP